MVENKKLSATNFTLEVFDLVFFTVQNTVQRIEGGVKTFQVEAEPKIK